MTQTVFLRLDTLAARASKTGTVLPSVVLNLCSYARLEFAFVDADDAVGPLEGDVVVVQACVKAHADDVGSLLLLTSLPETGSGSDSRRVAEWSDAALDNDELRAILGSSISITGTADGGPWMEVAITRDGKTDRVSFPITLRNAFLRPEDAAPNPREDASWEWLKARLLITGSSIARAIDDTLKTITLSVSMAWGDVTGKPSTFPPATHSHAISDVTGLDSALAAKADASLIGANGGIAPLDAGGKVPAANLPSYVDDIIEAANFAALPGTGETGKIYVTLDDNKTYRWSGSAYIEISATPAFASQAEAEAGTDNAKLMTPLRTAQAIAALGGGGGVGGILQAAISLQTNTTPGTDAGPPADLLITSSGASAVTGHVYITVGPTTFVFSFFSSDPSDGSYWIDSTGFTDDYSLLNALTTAINSVGTGATASFDGVTITLHYTATGTAAVLSGSNDFGYMSFTGGGTGADAAPGSGGITDQGLVSATTGKKVGLIRAWAAPASNAITSGTVRLSLYNPATSTWTAIGEAVVAGTAFVELKPVDKAVYWGVGRNTGETLRATLVDSADSAGITIDVVALYQIA